MYMLVVSEVQNRSKSIHIVELMSQVPRENWSGNNKFQVHYVQICSNATAAENILTLELTKIYAHTCNNFIPHISQDNKMSKGGKTEQNMLLEPYSLNKGILFWSWFIALNNMRILVTTVLRCHDHM